jgi:hypothetical protein
MSGSRRRSWTDRLPLTSEIKQGSSEGFDAKMQDVLHLARRSAGTASS